MIKDKRKYTGFPGDCSEDQLKALDQFRAVVTALDGGKLDPRWDEVYLLRFLRARKFNLKETEKMWRDHMAWRAKNNIDNVTVYYFPELLQLRKLFPHGYHKFTRNHSPIYIERLGFASPEEIWKVTTPDRLLAYYNVLYEALFSTIFEACSQQRLKDTGNAGRVALTCSILDLKDIKLGQASAAYKFVKPAAQMAQNNYPEMLGSMFILNAPFLFTGIWAIVRMWIDDKTKEKIHILGSGYKKELLKHVDPENLPDFIDGGLCKCKGGCLGTNPGPWNPNGEELFPNCLVEFKAKTEEQKLEKKQEEAKGEHAEKIEVKEEVQAIEKIEESEKAEKAEKAEKVEKCEESVQLEQISAAGLDAAEVQKAKVQQKPSQEANIEGTQSSGPKQQGHLLALEKTQECSVSPASKQEP